MESGPRAFHADFDRAWNLMLTWPDGGDPSPEWLAISAIVRHAVVTHYSYEDICNGGFEQYFWNHTGNLAQETVEAYEALGLPLLAETMRNAIALFPGGYARGRLARRERLGDLHSLDQALVEQWSKLDSVMFAALADADQNAWSIAVNEAAAKYVRG